VGTDALGRVSSGVFLSPFADWPTAAVRFKMLIKWRVGLTLGLERSLMHGVAPQMCGQVVSPLLGLGAGGRSPGYLMPASVDGPLVNARPGAKRPDKRSPCTTDLGFGSSSFSDPKSRCSAALRPRGRSRRACSLE